MEAQVKESQVDHKEVSVKQQSPSTALVNFPKDISELPLVNVKLSTINLFFNWANNFRSQYLIRQVAGMDSKIQSGQKHLSELQTNVSALNVEVKEQNAELNKALEDMRKQLEEQKQLLAEREKQIERFTLSQFQRDAALDSLIVGFSYMLVSSPIIQWPIDLVIFVLFYIPGVSKVFSRKRYATSLIQLLVILKMYYSARNLAVEKEWHNEVGSPRSYALYFMRKLKSAFDLTRKGIF